MPGNGVDIGTFHLSPIQVTSAAKHTNLIAQGAFDGSNDEWIAKKLNNVATLHNEIMTQQLFKLIIPHQPETRSATCSALYVVPPTMNNREECGTCYIYDQLSQILYYQSSDHQVVQVTISNPTPLVAAIERIISKKSNYLDNRLPPQIVLSILQKNAIIVKFTLQF